MPDVGQNAREGILTLYLNGSKVLGNFHHLSGTMQTIYASGPVKMWVTIDPPYHLVCRKRRLNGAVLRMRPENRGTVSQQVWHCKDPALLKGPERRA
jgi:hypothetical protein